MKRTREKRGVDYGILRDLKKKRIQQVFFYNFYDDDDVKRLFSVTKRISLEAT